MKVAIMQPYFFPYLGYFSLIKHTDRFILLDTVQYNYQGWLARNRILKPGDGWQYIRAPLIAHPHNTHIRDIMIRNQDDWKRRIPAQLQHYKKNSPYYNDVIALVNDIFSAEYEDITSLNHAALAAILEYLGIARNLEILSGMELNIKPYDSADEYALYICEALENVDEYWNPPGGKTFYDRSKYDEAGVKLRFHEIVITPYNQGRPTFEPGLSILDVLMFNSVEDTNAMLDNYMLS
jgi:hypothetical protein